MRRRLSRGRAAPGGHSLIVGARDLARPAFELLPAGIRRAVQVRLRARDWTGAGIVFVHIPKAAGTSINQALYGRFMGHARAREIRRYAPAEVNALPFFSVTRNPWDRLVSAYRFARLGAGVGGLVAGISNPGQYRAPEFATFERFVREWLAPSDLHRLDNVFQPQWPFVCDHERKPMVDHVGRVEALGPTHAFIERTLGRPVRFERQNRSGQDVDYRSFYTPALAAMVGEIYRDDVEIFGYDF